VRWEHYKDLLVKIWKETVMVCFSALTWHSPEDTEVKHEKY
jgi:hypothetical protein